MVQYLKDIKFLFPLLFILLSYTANAQIYPYGFGTKGYYNYTAVTDTAINIGGNSATIKGGNTRIKTSRTDTLSTNKAIQNYMVIVGVDSSMGTDVNFTGLTENTVYSYYHSILVRTVSGDKSVDYYKGTTKTFTTTSTMYAGTYITTSEGKYWSNSDGKLITIE